MRIRKTNNKFFYFPEENYLGLKLPSWWPAGGAYGYSICAG